jgi:hypothetical protein
VALIRVTWAAHNFQIKGLAFIFSCCDGLVKRHLESALILDKAYRRTHLADSWAGTGFNQVKDKSGLGVMAIN